MLAETQRLIHGLSGGQQEAPDRAAIQVVVVGRQMGQWQGGEGTVQLILDI